MKKAIIVIIGSWLFCSSLFAGSIETISGFGTYDVQATVASWSWDRPGAGSELVSEVLATGLISGPVRPGYLNLNILSSIESSFGYATLSIGQYACGMQEAISICTFPLSSGASRNFDTGVWRLPFTFGTPFTIDLTAHSFPAVGYVASSAGFSLDLTATETNGMAAIILDPPAVSNAPEPASFWLSLFATMLWLAAWRILTPPVKELSPPLA